MEMFIARPALIPGFINLTFPVSKVRCCKIKFSSTIFMVKNSQLFIWRTFPAFPF